MNKIISTTYLPSIGEDSPIQDLLFEASELISKLGTSEIPISERAKEILTKARALIGKAIFNAEEAIRLRSSSLTSTGSLGDPEDWWGDNWYKVLSGMGVVVGLWNSVR